MEVGAIPDEWAVSSGSSWINSEFALIGEILSGRIFSKASLLFRPKEGICFLPASDPPHANSRFLAASPLRNDKDTSVSFGLSRLCWERFSVLGKVL